MDVLLDGSDVTWLLVEGKQALREGQEAGVHLSAARPVAVQWWAGTA